MVLLFFIYQHLLILVNEKFYFYKNHISIVTDADGELEHILPVCMDINCLDSRIYVRDDNAVSVMHRIL